LDRRGGQAADKIKEQIAQLAQDRLDVIAKNGQKDHVAQDVGPACMKKHRRQQRDQMLPLYDLRRNDAVGHDELLQLGLAQRQFVQKGDPVDANQRPGEPRHARTTHVTITNGKHVSVSILWNLLVTWRTRKV
jgi:hypothetical protein